MQNQIIFADSTTFDLAQTPVNNRVHRPTNYTREWRQLRVVGSYADIAAAFVDNAEYQRAYETLISRLTGEKDTDDNDIYEDAIESAEPESLTEYSIAGEIIDHRDGTYTVYMGKPTEAESQRAAQLVWAELESGASIKAGDVVQYYGQLYVCTAAHAKAQARNPTNTEYWEVHT